MKNIPADHLCVGISLYCPEWLKVNHPDNFLFVENNFLAPTKELLEGIKNGSITQEEYKSQYKEQVRNRFQNFTEFNGFDDWMHVFHDEFSDKYSAVVFLCYEKPTDFCHRHILREMMNYEYRVRCDEFPYKDEQEQLKKELKPKALF
jgi:hypothetical protein